MLVKAGIPHNRIIEGDRPYEGQLMAIGVMPMDRKRVRKYLSDLPLVK
jgi:hypothetical protein